MLEITLKFCGKLSFIWRITMQSNSLGIGKEKKPFAWSYSKLKNFDTCPRRHLEIDVDKRFKDEESDTLKWGNEVHKHMAARLGEKKEPLPFAFKNFEGLAQRLEAAPGIMRVEQQLAIDENFTPCEWFSKRAWFRAIADVLVINDIVALGVDYKTGKILEDYQQLGLLSACVFAHYPKVMAIRTEAWWLRDDAITRQDFKRKDMPEFWRGIWPRYEQLKQAHETRHFPARPSGLCRQHCPVSSCEHNGKRK